MPQVQGWSFGPSRTTALQDRERRFARPHVPSGRVCLPWTRAGPAITRVMPNRGRLRLLCGVMRVRVAGATGGATGGAAAARRRFRGAGAAAGREGDGECGGENGEGGFHCGMLALDVETRSKSCAPHSAAIARGTQGGTTREVPASRRGFATARSSPTPPRWYRCCWRI